VYIELFTFVAGTECRYLDNLTPEVDVCETETAPDKTAVTKQ
jgi:hypothetical protein